MSTTEKLLAQIFERKKWIVNQTKHQAYLFEQHLASKCLIDGIDPPPWLLSSSSSDPNHVLNKQELISGVPLPRAQPVIHFTGSHCPVFDKPVPTAHNGELPNGLCTELHGFDRGFSAGEEVLILPHCRVSNAGCASNGVPQDQREEDPSVTSPDDQKDARISDIYYDPALSPARGAGNEVSNLPQCLINNAHCSSDGVPQDQREEDPSVTSPEDQRGARMSDIYHDPALSPARGAGDEVTILPQCPISNAGDSSNGVPQDQKEEDPSVTSPEGQGDAKTSNIYHDPALSLARVQRSKSRQRAIAIRNSTNKSNSQVKNNVDGCAGGIIGCAISFLQSDHVDEMNLVKPPDTCDNLELSAVNGEKHSSKETCSLEFVSGSTRSQVVCSVERIAKGASSNMSGQRIVAKDTSSNISGQRINKSMSAASNKSHDAQRTQISTGRSIPIQRDLDLCAVNSMDSSDKENVADHYTGRNTCTEINSGTEEMSKPINSKVLGHRGTQSRSAASNKHLPENLTHGLAGIRHQDVFSTMVQEVPCIQTSEFVEAASVGKTEIDPDGCIEANPIRSGSNLDSNGLRVGGEVLHSRQPADYAFVNPKQLNFEDVEESCLNGISTPDLKKGMQGRSSEKSYISLMHAEDILAEGITVNYHDNCNTPLEMSFLGDREVSVGGKDLQSSLSGAPEEQLHKSGRTSNENAASSVKEISNAHKDGVANTLLESGKVQKSFLIDNPTGLQVAQESLVESQSNVNSAKPTELVTEESALDSHAVGNPTVSTDSDFTIVSELGSFRIPDAKNLAVENPCAASTDGMKGNLPQPIIQSHISPNYEMWSIGDKVDVGYTKSTECRIAEKSKGRSFSSSMEGSWPQHKRRKIEHTIVDDLSSSQDLIEKVFHTVNRVSICGNLGSVEHSPKAVLESQGLSISQEDVVKSIVSRSPVEESHQNEDHQMIERSESSPKAHMKEGEISVGEGDRSGNAPFTFMHEELEASLLLSLMKQAAGQSQDCLMEETGVAHPTSTIVDTGSPCIEENHVSLPLEDNLTLGNVENWTCAGRAMQEKRFDLGGTRKFSYFSVGSPRGQSLDLIGGDDTKPELEGFVLETDDKPTSIARGDINFDECNLPSTTFEHASILEQLCKSVCMQTPVACCSASYKLHKIPNLYQSVPTGLLEGGVDVRTALPMNDAVKPLKDGNSCLSEEVGQAFNGRSYSDCLPNRCGQSGWDIKKPYISPVGKLWDRTASSTSSSGKRGSLNPELPCISEENENIDEVADTSRDGIVSEVLNSSIQRVPLADITEIPNPPASVSKAELHANRLSLDSVNTEFSLTETHKSFKLKHGIQNSIKRRYNDKENLSISRGTNDIKRTTGSLRKPKLSGKTSLRKGGPSLLEREPKRNNIVSSMTSFIPLVQQKQSAAVVTGKRDIKVKALEAAETAKRLAQKKENERKMKKEALKLERSRKEQVNMRQLELQKKQKEEERKKKDADMATKKRQREEEDRKEKERKRMRVEARRQQREHEDKLPAEKEDKEMKCQAIDGRGHESKESKDETAHKTMEEEREYDTFRNISETEPRTSRVSTSNARRESIILEEHSLVLSNFGYNAEVPSNLDKAIDNGNSAANTHPEQSYEISPYRQSDDENEEDGNTMLNSKFVPSWSSNNSLALAVSCRNGADPGAIFPEESFCSISEVLLPRKHQLNYNGMR
ncbi:PREDICTED: uncharacterized protein LOC103336964 [Prunus mume]|uniref:Uncharacterized protein LOC103336964 n=1 Tax=Prunus mume TaxID=102107 RepID=A0ABM0PE43_PRUMU|nr:PREDICTED: uncharacterized protein LOC103336964 [Prunus mume]